MTTFSLPLLPTSVVGSHAKPGWWHLIREEYEKGNLGPMDLQEALDDAVDVAILDQERAAVDIITDGEMRRLSAFYRTYLPRIQGIQTVPPQRRLGETGYDTRWGWEVVERVFAPQGLGIVEEFQYLKAHTTRSTKVTCAGPQTFAAGVAIKGGYGSVHELAWDLAKIINAELKALVKAGATFIQVDEPAFSEIAQDGKGLAELFNYTVEGVPAKIAMHICFGNHHGRPLVKRNYQRLFPGVLEAKAEQFVLEFANRELAELDLWQKWGAPQELGAGLIDQKSYYIETPQDVAERIRTALKYVVPEKLFINPDCGFNPTPRSVCQAKLKAMVEGTKMVRKELAG